MAAQAIAGNARSSAPRASVVVNAHGELGLVVARVAQRAERLGSGFRLRVTRIGNSSAHGSHGARAMHHKRFARTLERIKQRQHEISQLGRLGHEAVHDHQAVKPLQRLNNRRGARQIERRVAAHNHRSLQAAGTQSRRKAVAAKRRGTSSRRRARRLLNPRDALCFKRSGIGPGNAVNPHTARMVHVA